MDVPWNPRSAKSRAACSDSRSRVDIAAAYPVDRAVLNHHVVDRCGIDARQPLQEFANDVRGEVVGADGRQRAAVAAVGRTDAGHEKRGAHGGRISR
jgi:hypothetical protein